MRKTLQAAAKKVVVAIWRIFLFVFMRHFITAFPFYLDDDDDDDDEDTDGDGLVDDVDPDDDNDGILDDGTCFWFAF